MAGVSTVVKRGWWLASTRWVGIWFATWGGRASIMSICRQIEIIGEPCGAEDSASRISAQPSHLSSRRVANRPAAAPAKCREPDTPPTSTTPKRTRNLSASPERLQLRRTLRRRLVGPMSFRQLNKTGTFFTVAAPGMDGIGSTRLRGQRSCAVPEGHRTHQPPPATAPPNPLLTIP